MGVVRPPWEELLDASGPLYEKDRSAAGTSHRDAASDRHRDRPRGLTLDYDISDLRHGGLPVHGAAPPGPCPIRSASAAPLVWPSIRSGRTRPDDRHHDLLELAWPTASGSGLQHPLWAAPALSNRARLLRADGRAPDPRTPRWGRRNGSRCRVGSRDRPEARIVVLEARTPDQVAKEIEPLARAGAHVVSSSWSSGHADSSARLYRAVAASCAARETVCLFASGDDGTPGAEPANSP